MCESRISVEWSSNKWDYFPRIAVEFPLVLLEVISSDYIELTLLVTQVYEI